MKVGIYFWCAFDETCSKRCVCRGQPARPQASCLLSEAVQAVTWLYGHLNLYIFFYYCLESFHLHRSRIISPALKFINYYYIYTNYRRIYLNLSSQLKAPQG